MIRKPDMFTITGSLNSSKREAERISSGSWVLSGIQNFTVHRKLFLGPFLDHCHLQSAPEIRTILVIKWSILG